MTNHLALSGIMYVPLIAHHHPNLHLTSCFRPQTERESPLPKGELEGTPGRDKHQFRNEFVYGLGESTGSVVKNDRKFTMEARDAMGYDMDLGMNSLEFGFILALNALRIGDPMYKAGTGVLH